MVVILRCSLAGLARVPCLYAIGTFFRGASSNIEVLEFFRRKSTSKHLNELEDKEAPDIQMVGNMNESVTSDGELAICIEITSEILKSELPEYLQNNAIRFRLTPMPRPEAFIVEKQVEDFAIRIKTVIDSVSKRARIVHLFISAQSAVVFTLGRMYKRECMAH